LLVEESNAGRLLVPLTATNLYETHKIDIQERREHLAWVQATLSQGMVFRPAPPFKSASNINHIGVSGFVPSGAPNSTKQNKTANIGVDYRESWAEFNSSVTVVSSY
jgi:hypothetical protein